MSSCISKNNFGLDNDSKGKLHEILVAKHLDPQSRFPERLNELIEYCACESEDLHNKIVQKLGGINSVNYAHHNKVAVFAAEQILVTLRTNKTLSHNKPIIKVYWTSNPSDFFSLTKIKEKSTSDLMFQPRKADIVAVVDKSNYIGLSLKVHNRKRISSLCSPGQVIVDDLLKVNTTQIYKDTIDLIKKNSCDRGYSQVLDMPLKQSHQLEKENKDLLNSNAIIFRNGSDKIAKIYKNVLDTNNELISNFIKSIVCSKSSKIKIFKSSTFGTTNLTNVCIDIDKENKKIVKTHLPFFHIKETKGPRHITFGGKDGNSILRLEIRPAGSGGFQSLKIDVKGWCSLAKT